MKKEIEIKFTNIQKTDIISLLKGNGFICTTPEFLMKRKTFHNHSSQKNEWFRVRKEYNQTSLTYKCIHENTLSGVEEIETKVLDFDATSEILIKTGLKNTATQENLREIWQYKNIEVCIDTWPGLTPFIEIEGPSEAEVISMVEVLGFSYQVGLFGGVEMVYQKELGIPPEIFIKLPEVTFQNPPLHPRTSL